MKLRNKRTGDIWEFDGISMAISDSTKEKIGARGCSGSCYARSLSELNEEWEDYKPAEPLIKDEKIRKAVRAWAEANDIRYARKCGSLNAYTRRLVGFDALGTGYTIEFEKHLKLYGDPDKIEKDSYTIAELCGEEE